MAVNKFESYKVDHRGIVAPAAPSPVIALTTGDRVGYALATGFDPTRRGTVVTVAARLVYVAWDDQAGCSPSPVGSGTVAKVGALSRAWSRC
jgi:hypothetical protein